MTWIHQSDKTHVPLKPLIYESMYNDTIKSRPEESNANTTIEYKYVKMDTQKKKKIKSSTIKNMIEVKILATCLMVGRYTDEKIALGETDS